MSKHIHIHVHSRTADAGFKESDHPRGKGGKFATSGSGGGTAEHHEAKAMQHRELAKTKGKEDADSKHHLRAAESHEEAAGHLKSANNASQSGKGYAKGVPDKLTQAQSASEAAAGHESKIGKKLNLNKESDRRLGSTLLQQAGTPVKKEASVLVGREAAKANARKASQEAAAKKEADFKALEKHPMHHPKDLASLRERGYEPEEIKELWDRDQKAGKGRKK